ncbi:unnamed protein product [Lactuca virosa]|uniref:Uncharacterized protein n=1 Tax=Lactuca virosa TaxID=75947 RepID=A0AAU9LZ25_9ASTR|nr:unnamed protein product [Lactuca virosa]
MGTPPCSISVTVQKCFFHHWKLLQNPKNYGSLKNLDHIKISIFTKQTDSLQKIMLSMTKTLEELNGVVLFLAKTICDAKQQVKGGSVKQLHLRIGVKPSIADCLEGLQILQEMYQSEYRLKSLVMSAIASLALNPSVDDLQALERILVDQPNILKEEVQSIYDVIFAEEIC